MKYTRFIILLLGLIFIETYAPLSAFKSAYAKPLDADTLDDRVIVISIFTYVYCLRNEGYDDEKEAENRVNIVIDILSKKWNIPRKRVSNIIESPGAKEEMEEYLIKSGGCKSLIKGVHSKGQNQY